MRPALGVADCRITLRLYQGEVALLRRIGQGNLADGFHRVMSAISRLQDMSALTSDEPYSEAQEQVPEEW